MTLTKQQQHVISQTLSEHSRLLLTRDELTRYQENCEGFEQTVCAAVKIHSISDIQAILRLAATLANTDDAFSVYPISTGHNWGYGSSLPTDQKSIILDLSALNNIRLEDATLGLITVEPGVTQQQLRDFLDTNKLPYMVPVTGAGPSCSILANALERGYGITPYTDHFGAVNAIKAVLADGSLFQSAISELDGSGQDFIDKTFKYGVGPYLDGILTQSNLAIVTEITIRLKAEPEAFEAFYIQIPDEQDFILSQQLVFSLLQKLEGIVGSINMMDRRRLAAMMAENPNKAGTGQVMSEQQVADIARQYSIPAWTIAGTLYGQKSVVLAARREIKRFSRQLRCKILFSNGAVIRLAKALFRILPAKLLVKPRSMLASLEDGIAIMKGYPTQMALPLTFWQNAYSKADKTRLLNPASDGCGLLWYAPLVPMRADQMLLYIQHVRSICPQYGIEPMITFTSLRHDTVDSTIPIVFNRRDQAAVDRAKACLEHLVTEGLAQGWVPYRLNISQQKTLLQADSVFWTTVRGIKTAMDPNNIISPGRYQP